ISSVAVGEVGARYLSSCFSIFQAEDGIRCRNVTGVQTCALRSRPSAAVPPAPRRREWPRSAAANTYDPATRRRRRRRCAVRTEEIGRASCRESGQIELGGGSGGEHGGVQVVHELGGEYRTLHAG